MEGLSKETAHNFSCLILNSHFMKWVVLLPTLDHNHMHPVIFTEFDLHTSASALPPPATAPLEENIETIVLSKGQTTLGQTCGHSEWLLSLACRHLQTHSVLVVQYCVLGRAEDMEAPYVVQFCQEGKPRRLRGQDVVTQAVMLLAGGNSWNKIRTWMWISLLRGMVTTIYKKKERKKERQKERKKEKTPDTSNGNFPWMPMWIQQQPCAVSEARCPQPQDSTGMYKDWR